MPLAPPGSFAWLAAHELRLAWRNRGKGARRVLLLVLLGGYCLAGVAAAVALFGVPIGFTPWRGTLILAASLGIASFMVTQAILGSQQTLYGRRDLDLLFTAPIDPRRVLLAKLAGIAGAIVLSYFVLLLPIVLPVALAGHPGLLGVVGLLVAMACSAATIGIAITLVLARLAGPRAARTVGQIAAALLGGAFFLISQLSRGGGRAGAAQTLFAWLQARGLGASGWSGVPGHAAFGDLFPLFILLAIGAGLFAAAGAALRRLFLSGYQDASATVSRSRPTGKATGRLFHAGLFRSVLAKEFRLLRRDPGLLFQVVLRLIYLAPMVLWAFRGNGELIAPGLAFASVLVATQLTGSLAWLTVSGEDAPELIAVAPISKAQVDTAKLVAALIMAAPFALAIPLSLAMACRTPLGALIALAMSATGGALSGVVELKLGKPGQRSTFARRRRGSIGAGLLVLLISVVFGGGAGALVYLIGR